MRNVKRWFAAVPVAFALLVASGITAAAANCRPGDVAGTWVAFAPQRDFMTCLIVVDNFGKLERGSCFYPRSTTAEARITGNLRIDKIRGHDCSVRGEFKIKRRGVSHGPFQFRGSRSSNRRSAAFEGIMIGRLDGRQDRTEYTMIRLD